MDENEIDDGNESCWDNVDDDIEEDAEEENNKFNNLQPLTTISNKKKGQEMTIL